MNHGSFVRSLWVVLLAASAMAYPRSGAVQAQTFSPYSDFQATTLTELQTLQVQLSPQGPSDETMEPVTFTSTVNTINLAEFDPFRRAGVDYSDGAGATFQATPEELKAIIDNVATLANVTAGGVDPSPRMSFAMVNLGKGFEAVLNKADAIDLFEQIRLGLANNREGQVALDTLECPLNLLPPEQPTDVSADVSVERSGFRLDRATGLFVGDATITNNSGASLPGPISLVLNMEDFRVQLQDPDGTTCGTTPVGLQFVNLLLDGNALAAGASSTLVLRFDNPDKVIIDFTTKVLAGPGAR